MSLILSLITIGAPLIGAIYHGRQGFVVGAVIGLVAFFINLKTGGFRR